MIIGTMLIAAAPVSAHSHRDWQKERGHIEDRARSQRGTRYNYGGGTPGSGFDCSGYTRWVFSEHGASLPHSSMEQFNMGRREGYKRVWKIRKLEVGDLVFFKTTSARVGHAGIYIGNGRFIHSSSSGGGVRIDSVNDPYYYRARFVGATRVPATQRFTG
jgi:cell wall-associated NlpC family hydrolase